MGRCGDSAGEHGITSYTVPPESDALRAARYETRMV